MPGFMAIRDVDLFVDVVGHGPPLLLMHGGPGVDHTTLAPFRALADEFTLTFYDHRCNGRSGGDVTTMTMDNLVADAEALREALGHDRWAVLGHSFGGMVAAEYALQHPDRVSRLILADTAGDGTVASRFAPDELQRRGYRPATVALARRFFTGEIAPREMRTAILRFGKAYTHHLGPRRFLGTLLAGFRMKSRPEALIHGYSSTIPNWSIMDRLADIHVPTLVMAGRHDFQFPPSHQAELAAGIPGARIEIIEDTGHNAHWERPDAVLETVRSFLSR